RPSERFHHPPLASYPRQLSPRGLASAPPTAADPLESPRFYPLPRVDSPTHSNRRAFHDGREGAALSRRRAARRDSARAASIGGQAGRPIGSRIRRVGLGREPIRRRGEGEPREVLTVA